MLSSAPDAGQRARNSCPTFSSRLIAFINNSMGSTGVVVSKIVGTVGAEEVMGTVDSMLASDEGIEVIYIVAECSVEGSVVEEYFCREQEVRRSIHDRKIMIFFIGITS